MAILMQKNLPSSHWYRRDGSPCHEVFKADGESVRATTLADARKLHLLPSVTTIMGVLDKPALSTWKQKQAILACVRIPRQPDEPEDYWMARVLDAAGEETSKAADLGTEIHDALETATVTGECSLEMEPYIRPLLDWMQESDIVLTGRELPVVSPSEGYAGRVDAFFTDSKGCLGILDYKTRKTKPKDKIAPYDGQAMQLAAYAAAHYGVEDLPTVRALNVYISSTEPGRFHVHQHDDIAAEYSAFLAVCHIWRHAKGYDPRS